MSGERDVLIRGGRVLDPAGGRDEIADLLVVDGRIAPPGRRARGAPVVAAENCLVLPGLADLAADLGAAELAARGGERDLRARLDDAAAAGITALCHPPAPGPTAASLAALESLKRGAARAGKCRIFALGAATRELQGRTLGEMAAMRDAGCVGVTNRLAPFENTQVLRRALEYAASLELTVFLHPLDAALAGDGRAHEGAVAARLGLPGIPVAAETAALGQQLALIEDVGARAHFCRLSCARSVEMIAAAQRAGLEVSADVGVRHLFLTDESLAAFDPAFHLLPPLRAAADRDALRVGLRDGVIAAVCSDHQAHDAGAKLAPFPETAPGAPAMHALLPLMLELADAGALELAAAVAALTVNPARLLGGGPGTLAPGAPADLCIVERRAWTDQVAGSPFAGRAFAWRVRETFVGGRRAA